MKSVSVTEIKSRKYSRITYTERLIIEKMYNHDESMNVIATRLKRSVSTISYEIHRGLVNNSETDKYYSADTAQNDAEKKACSKGRIVKLAKHDEYAETISNRIRSGESPDSIVGDLKNKNQWTVCTPTLYRYIDRNYIPGITNKNLVVKSKRKRKYYQIKKPCRAPKGETIEKRPEEINSRKIPGHWEMDTVIGTSKGKEESLLVLTERVTRYEIIQKLTEKTMLAVTEKLSEIVGKFPEGTFRTITVDNGSENMDYDGMKKLVSEVYYCHPYSSYERGSNENANKVIRRFFPKGESMAAKTQRDADDAAGFMNNMHRRILGYRTSEELFSEWQEYLVSASSPGK